MITVSLAEIFGGKVLMLRPCVLLVYVAFNAHQTIQWPHEV